MRRTLACGLAAAFCTALVGCAGQGLPVRRVAIYRNGVAYLERAGHVGEHAVRFRMKESEIGDFLATLAVTEQGGRSVRTAAFPIEARGSKDEDKDAERTVVLSLDGASHDLRVGYVEQAPVWKPSYRLVIEEGGAAELQVWGMVQNLSGEDWRDVQLSLIAGAPIAFSSDMQTPVIPNRPTVVDRGESIEAVPSSEVAVASAQVSQQLSAPVTGHGKAPASWFHAKSDALVTARNVASSDGYSGESAYAASPIVASPVAPGAVTPEFFGGSTRYDLSGAVTIPNDSTSMVMVLSRRVKGDEIFLYAPNAGIPSSATHPFRAVRFANDTGGELDPGPMALFRRGVFLGQALVEPVPVGASATLPFALDRAVTVEVEPRAESAQGAGERVVGIAGGKLSVAVGLGARTVYRIRNGGAAAATVLVKHALPAGSRIVSPTTGTEERVGQGDALVSADVPPHELKELAVEEQTEKVQVTNWFSDRADRAVRAYMADPKSDREAVRKLGSAWSLREEAVARMRDRDHLRQERYDLQQSTEELRRNLHAAGGGSGDELRAKLGSRLAQAVAQIADRDKKIAALDEDVARVSDAFESLIGDVRVAR